MNAPAAEGGTAPLVLVVDDYQDGRELVVDILTLAGYRSAEAADGVEALEKVAELRPPLILMDLALPRMDGWEVTRRLKSDPATADIRVIALTAHALASHAREAREAGCDGFVTKPCTRNQLVEEIERVMGLAEARQPERGA